MNLVLTGDSAKLVLDRAKTDNNLAELVARQLLMAVDAPTLARYLLTDELALELLSERVAIAPEETLHELERLAAGQTVRSSSVRARAQVTVKTQTREKSGSRVRLTAAQITEIKDRVLEVLRSGPANRTRLRQAVRFPSAASYTKIMGELRAEGVVTAQGERRLTVYKLSAAGKRGRTRARR